MKRVCIQWPRFGPYHLARLEAANQYFRSHDVEVIGLETAENDATYAWQIEQGESSFRRVQVFPDKTFDELSSEEIHQGVTARLDELDPDAVAINSYSLPDARACLSWCRRHHRTAVVMSETKMDDAIRVRWREHIKARIINEFDAALVAGSPHRTYFEELGLRRDAIYLGYSTVDNTYFREGAASARREPDTVRHLSGLEADSPFFLASGRFIPRKNLVGLVEAYRIYRQGEENPWRLVLLGDGPERQSIEMAIRNKQIEGITLAGFRQIDELPAYFGLAGTFVHPPLADQWGLVVNEAMAAGLPVLVSERSGCAEDLVNEGENGYRFNPENPEDLARLLKQMSGAETDRAAMGIRSQEIIAEWSIDRFSKELWRAIQNGLERGRRGPNPATRIILWILRRTARSPNSFHTVDL